MTSPTPFLNEEIVTQTNISDPSAQLNDFTSYFESCFSTSTKYEFEEYLNSPTSTNQSLFGVEKRDQYKFWLETQDVRSENVAWHENLKTIYVYTDRQKYYNARNDCFTNYEIKNGRLCRKEFTNSKTGKSLSPRIVVTLNEVFDVIKNVHGTLKHAGITKTHEKISQRYFGIARPDVSWLLARCRNCMVNRPNRSKGVLEPIISNCTLERVQIDLVDFRHEPDGQYKWVLHIRDHFSKYTTLYPLKSKQCVEVAEKVSEWIGHFGPPKILQCDNGKEFKGILLILLKQHGIKVINGRPRNPQTQGLVEQANGTFKTKLRAWKIENNSTKWVMALPEIALAMNLQQHSGIKKAAYEVMFNRAPRWIDQLDPATRNSTVLSDIEDETPENEEEIQEIDGWQVPYTFDMEIGNETTTVVTANNISVSVGFGDREDSESNCFIDSTDHQSDVENIDVQPTTDEQLQSEILDSEIPIEICSVTGQIHLTSIEKAVQKQADNSRGKMIKKHSRQNRIEHFVPDDLVTLAVPREDRASTDPIRLLCRVIKESHRNRYQLQCPYGILKNHYSTNQLLRVPDSEKSHVSGIIGSVTTLITLHTAARLQSTSDRVSISCNCKKECKGRCRCLKNQVQCSVYCHSDEHDCGNLSALTIRTEIALIDDTPENTTQRRNLQADIPSIAANISHSNTGNTPIDQQIRRNELSVKPKLRKRKQLYTLSSQSTEMEVPNLSPVRRKQARFTHHVESLESGPGTGLFESYKTQALVPSISRQNYQSATREHLPMSSDSLPTSIPDQTTLDIEQLHAVESASTDKIELDSVYKRIARNHGNHIVLAIQHAKLHSYPLLSKIREASTAASIEDKVRQLESIVTRTINNYQLLEFYQSHKQRQYLRYGQTTRARASITAAAFNQNQAVPVGYYCFAQIELIPAIVGVDCHRTLLQRKLKENNEIDSEGEAIIREVIAPEIITHMISLDIKITYDDALVILKDEQAKIYGEQCETEEIVLLLESDVNGGITTNRSHEGRNKRRGRGKLF